MARAAEDLRRLASELASLTTDDRERVLAMLGDRLPPRETWGDRYAPSSPAAIPNNSSAEPTATK